MKHMCRILSVSEAGYYRYKRNCGKPSRDAVLSAAMQSIRAESAYNDNYGVPRMRLVLRQRGLRVGLRRVRRLMIELGWIHPPRRRPYGLTHATTEIQEKENRTFLRKHRLPNCLPIFPRYSARTVSCTFLPSWIVTMVRSSPWK